jgi:hypothetical protein
VEGKKCCFSDWHNVEPDKLKYKEKTLTVGKEKRMGEERERTQVVNNKLS